MVQPTAEEQLFLELVNRARSNPLGEAALYDIDLNGGLAPGTISDQAKQPLAWNFDLINAGRNHNQWMLDNNTFSHTGEAGSDAGERIQAAGYEFTGSWAWGENLAWQVITNPDDLAQTIQLQHRGLFESPSHRTNLLNGDFQEIGIGLSSGQFQGWSNVSVTTHNFAKSGDDLFLTGVAFSDSIVNDDFYTVGEGLGGITVIAVRITDQQSFITTTMDAGGYQMALEAGTYQVTFSGAPLPQSYTQTVVVDTQNVKLDLDLNDLTSSGVLSDGSSSDNNQSLTAGTTMNIQFDTGNSGYVYGTHGEDYLNGLAGNDIIYAYRGNDILVGGTGNDYLSGGSGDDTLIGTSIRNGIDNNLGAGEIDTLVGSIGRDTFVLGDAYDAFYRFQGNSDYAVIEDFISGVDTIQLHGSADNYNLNISGSNTEIFYGSDLIAILKGAQLTDADLSNGSFNFV